MQPLTSKVMVIGIDGATFDIIDPLLAKGALPNMARLIQDGSRGVLRSTVPDLSPTAWSSFMTGTHPGKHGIIDFFGQRPGTYQTFFYNASFRRTKPVWMHLSEAGKKVCVINVPLSFPPDSVNGVMISGMDTPDITSDFIHPPQMRGELEREIGGFLLERAERNVGRHVDRYVQKLKDVNQNRFDAAQYLLKKEPWDFFMIVFESTDRVQHNFWKYIDDAHPEYTAEANARYGHLINDTYMEIDRKIGDLITDLPDDYTVILMSDHGSGPLYKGFRLTRWLAQKGYLKMNRPPSAIDILWRKAAAKIKSRTGKNPDAGLLAHFDMAHTQAYPLGGHGSLCINLEGRQPGGIVSRETYENLRAALVKELKTLVDPQTGKPVMDAVYLREELYDVFPENMPDILIAWARGYHFIGEREMALLGIAAAQDDLFTPHRWSGNHRPEGILVVNGPHTPKGANLAENRIIDVSPLICALFSIKVPADMDGKVIQGALSPDYLDSLDLSDLDAPQAPDTGPREQADYTAEEAEQIHQRLKDLGYI